MTNKEAVQRLLDTEWLGSNDKIKEMEEAVKKAVKALEFVDKVKTIINSPVYIQEDVFRYKAICQTIEDGED